MATQFGHDQLEDVTRTIVDVSLGTRYGALVNAFKPGYVYWECGKCVHLHITCVPDVDVCAHVS